MIKVYQITDQESIFPNCSFTYGMGISKSFDPIKNLDKFECVATLCTHDLNEAFEIGNIGPEKKMFDLAVYWKDGMKFNKMHSISVGDILVKENGSVYIVASTGFDQLGVFEYDDQLYLDEDPDAVYGGVA
jgi:hypothetical protein